VARKDSNRILEIREKANQQRREQQRVEKRKTILIQSGIAVGIIVVVAAVVGGILWAQSSRTPSAPPTASGTISLQGTPNIPFGISGTAVTVGMAGAPVTIDLYEDYSCPHCADYEAAVGPTLLKLVASGDAIVNFHPIKIVTGYGLAAGSAAACVAENNAQKWPDFHTALFANHSQTSDGWGAKDFVAFAGSMGITDKDTVACITDARYTDWITSNTAASRDAGVTGTPTLFINGKQQSSLPGPDQLIAAVNAAKG